MPVDAIGNAQAVTGVSTASSSISQDEFIKLFMAQLNYQDPLEPLNNREFLAQLAQFSSLEQSRKTNENLESLLAMNSSNQALNLLGKEVEVSTNAGENFIGVIEAVHYSTAGPNLTIKNQDGTFMDNVTLGQIKVVQTSE